MILNLPVPAEIVDFYMARKDESEAPQDLELKQHFYDYLILNADLGLAELSDFGASKLINFA